MADGFLEEVTLEHNLKGVMLARRKLAWDLFSQRPKGPHLTRLRQKGNLVYSRRGPQFRGTAVGCGCNSVGTMLAEHAQNPGFDPKDPDKLDTMARVCNPSSLAW